MNARPVVAVTLGDVCGIGPEIVARTVTDPTVAGCCQPLVIGNLKVVQDAVTCFGLPHFPLQQIDSPARNLILEAHHAGSIPIFDPWSDCPELPSSAQVDAAAGEAAYRYLIAAIKLARTDVVDAVATAPLNKAALHAAGHMYPGHTEILARECGVHDFAMMLYLSEERIAPLRQLVRSESGMHSPAMSGISIAHVTLHTSIRSVPDLLTADGIQEKVRLMNGFLKDLGDSRRAIAVCALNPHGGEQGLFGNEEKTIIAPAVESLRGQLNLHGPLPVDTLIRRAISGEFDGVVAMYHDQGHIPVKMIGMDAAVNITLGLPIIRTSPTHGTAFDRAWNPETPADSSGMKEAIRTAVTLFNGRQPKS